MAGGLYAIIDPTATGSQSPVELAEAVLHGGCARLQLRWKNAVDRSRLQLGRTLVGMCRARSVPFVMNDRADLARVLGADGLHLGQDDIGLGEAREIVGPGVEIGLSTHSREQALAAAKAGADLIALGPVWSTRSKARPDPVVGLDTLRSVCAAVETPVVAIGGIDEARATSVREAGAKFGAVISALRAGDETAKIARRLHAALGGSTC